MRRLLLGILLALCLPASAQAAQGRVSAFFYPWYGTSAEDGSYVHWAQLGHVPPDDIASSYYPAAGLYSSSDRLVLRPSDLAISDGAAATASLHAGGAKLYAQTGLVGAAASAGFNGVYTYDIV